MHKKVQNILRVFLLFGAIYFFADALIHFFDIKLLNIGSAWPASALAYARLMDKVAGVFISFMGISAFVVHKDPRKYKTVIYLSAVWTLILGLSFVYLGMSTDYLRIFGSLSSLSFWIPSYKEFLYFEAGALFCYSALVYIWFRSRPDA